MTLTELKDYVLPRTPFAEIELKDNIIIAGFEDSINYYNKFNPMTKILPVFCNGWEYTFYEDSAVEFDVPEYILRVYFYDGFTQRQNQERLVYDWNYIKPILQVAPGNYIARCTFNITLDNVNFDKDDLLAKLFMCECNIKMANKRRSAEMTELPFELKGDLFFDQYMEEKRELKEAISNLPNVSW